MSTRCVINFCEQGQVRAKIYRHSDGYPEGEHGVPADLERFFTAVEGDTTDTRFTDASYLAAKYVVWQAAQFARRWDPKTDAYTPNKPLDFLSLGVVMSDPGDIEWSYFVDCDYKANAKRPGVKYGKPGDVPKSLTRTRKKSALASGRVSD